MHPKVIVQLYRAIIQYIVYVTCTICMHVVQVHLCVCDRVESHIAETITRDAAGGVVVDHWPPNGAPPGGSRLTLSMW